jgi:hypothetical protein
MNEVSVGHLISPITPGLRVRIERLNLTAGLRDAPHVTSGPLADHSGGGALSPASPDAPPAGASQRAP